MSNAIKQAPVDNQEQNQEQAVPQFTDGVTAKVSDSRKCVSIYGIVSERMPFNLTIEMFDTLTQNWDAIQHFVESSRDQLMSKSERKSAKGYEKQDAKLIAKQAKLDEARILTLALQLAKKLKDSA